LILVSLILIWKRVGFVGLNFENMMRKLILLFLFISWAVGLVHAQEKPKKLVFIILDGIPYDVIRDVETPHIDRIAAAGGFSKAYVGGERGGYSETPTVSAVGYNSLLTGTWVHKHNVTGNSIQNPNYNYWTIFRYLREARPDAHLAIFSSWEDNRTKLIGEGLEATGYLQMDYSFDGFEFDTIAFPHDKGKRYIAAIDAHVVDEATRYIDGHGPDLSWVYLEYPDDMGHQFGDSPQFFDAVREVDRQAGQIYDAVLARMEQKGEDWMILVTTDHGRRLPDGRDHGGQSDREREIWIATNAAALNPYFERETVAIVDVLPTMLRHLAIPVPSENLDEVDGVPLIGEVSVYHPMVKRERNELIFTWQFIGNAEEEVEIWVADQNRFLNTGKSDQYQLAAKVRGSLETWTMPFADANPLPVKFLIKGKYNSVNRWLVSPQLED
jgi:hypothetical protein